MVVVFLGWLLGTLIVMTLVTIYVVVYPFPWLKDLLQVIVHNISIVLVIWRAWRFERGWFALQ